MALPRWWSLVGGIYSPRNLRLSHGRHQAGAALKRHLIAEAMDESETALRLWLRAS
jgi:hypothetical protein